MSHHESKIESSPFIEVHTPATFDKTFLVMQPMVAQFELPVIYRKKDLQYKESFRNTAHSSICSKRILDFFYVCLRD